MFFFPTIVEGMAPGFGHSSRETINVRPNLPEEVVNVDMMVLARKRPMKWQQGKVTEILTKGKKHIYLKHLFLINNNNELIENYTVYLELKLIYFVL